MHEETHRGSPLPTGVAAGLIGAMTVLPIVGREMRVASRRASTHWSRAIVGACVLVICTWVLLVMRTIPAHQQSKVLFGTLTGGALLNVGSWVFMIMVFVGAYALAYFMRRQWT